MRGILTYFIVLQAVVIGATSAPAAGQRDMQHSNHTDSGPLGIPETRMGSGTAWLPDSSPMHAAHYVLGRWTLMVHGTPFLQYDWQGGPRGSSQLGLTNWGMLMATRRVGRSHLQLRAMLSAEPWTIGNRGYPLLVQTGETYRGAPLHDRQHPHDL